MLREDKGFTEEALALKSGVSRNVLMDVEARRRGLLYERFFDLTEVLGVLPTELLIGPVR